jgi:hypothetical protein
MIADFAQNGSIGEAIEMTFTGENPCSICELSDALSVVQSPVETASLVPLSQTIDFRLMGCHGDSLSLALKESGRIVMLPFSPAEPERPRPDTRPG